MKVGIIVYSRTGNTLSVAKRIKGKIKNENVVNIEQIEIKGDGGPGVKDIEFTVVPDIKDYDTVIFGSPVEAFSLNTVMKKYLEQIKSLANKQVVCYVTKALPFNWTGGNQAISYMKKVCQSKKGEIISTGVVKCNKFEREKSMNRVVNDISRMIV
ncbi:MAG: flavodoxin family protein [Halanaerobiaceae bacterium]